jgi:predicted nucleic acid-binding protein
MPKSQPTWRPSVDPGRGGHEHLELEVAVAGQADFIVTGDDDLLALHPFEGIPTIGPAEFLAALEAAPARPST